MELKRNMGMRCPTYQKNGKDCTGCKECSLPELLASVKKTVAEYFESHTEVMRDLAEAIRLAEPAEQSTVTPGAGGVTPGASATMPGAAPVQAQPDLPGAIMALAPHYTRSSFAKQIDLAHYNEGYSDAREAAAALVAAAAPVQAQPVASDEPTWQRITAPGQVKVGTNLRFTIGDDKYSETAKRILHAGTAREEIIYNKARNFYLITSMAIADKGSQKKVEFLAATQPTTAPDELSLDESLLKKITDSYAARFAVPAGYGANEVVGEVVRLIEGQSASSPADGKAQFSEYMRWCAETKRVPMPFSAFKGAALAASKPAAPDCGTCDGNGVLGSPPDNYFHCPECAAPSIPASKPAAFPDECVASGQSCSYGPHGMNGERQCKYCAAAPSIPAQAGVPDGWRAWLPKEPARWQAGFSVERMTHVISVRMFGNETQLYENEFAYLLDAMLTVAAAPAPTEAGKDK